MGKLRAIFIILAFIQIISSCSASDRNQVSDKRDGVQFVGRMIEEGRTFVHHTLKRFMIILPAIFFKLGIAFTLLVLVTIVAINNGFIGFLLLVVGLSSVLARLQEARRPAAAPYIAPPQYYHGAHILDRNDNAMAKNTAEDSTLYSPSYQYYSNNKPYQLYYGSKLVS